MKTYQFCILFLLLTQCIHNTFASVVARDNEEPILQKRNVGAQAAKRVGKGAHIALGAAAGVAATTAGFFGFHKLKGHIEKKAMQNQGGGMGMQNQAGSMPPPPDPMAGPMVRRSITEGFGQQHFEKRNGLGSLFKHPVRKSLMAGGAVATVGGVAYAHHKHKKAATADAPVEPVMKKRDELARRGAASLSASAMIGPLKQGAGTIARTTKHVAVSLAKQTKTGFRNLSPNARAKLVGGAAATTAVVGGGTAIALDRKLSRSRTPAQFSNGVPSMEAMSPMKRSLDEGLLQKREPGSEGGPPKSPSLSHTSSLERSASHVGEIAQKAGKSGSMNKKGAAIALAGASMIGLASWTWHHFHKTPTKQSMPPASVHGDMPSIMQKRALALEDEGMALQLDRRSPLGTTHLMGAIAGGSAIAGASAMIGHHYGKLRGELQAFKNKPGMNAGMGGAPYYRRSLVGEGEDDVHPPSLQKRDMSIDATAQHQLQRRNVAAMAGGIAVASLFSALIGEQIGKMRGELAASTRLATKNMGMSRMYRRSVSYDDGEMTFTGNQKRSPSTLWDGEAGDGVLERRGLEKFRNAFAGLRGKATAAMSKGSGRGPKLMAAAAGVGLAAVATGATVKHFRNKKKAAGPVEQEPAPEGEPMPMKRSLQGEATPLLQGSEPTVDLTGSQSNSLEKRSVHIPGLGEVSHSAAAGMAAAIAATSAVVGERYGHLKGELEGTRKSVSSRSSGGMMY